MDANQVNHGDVELLTLKLTHPGSGTAWLEAKSPEVFFRASPAGGDMVVLQSDDGHNQAEAKAPDENAVRRILSMPAQVVAWVVTTKDTTVHVEVLSFAPGGFPNQEIVIGVDDTVAGKVRSDLRRRQAPFGDVRDWLARELTLPGALGASSDQVRIIHSGSPEASGSPRPDAFTLLGHEWAADVVLRDDRLQVTRLLHAGNRRGQRWPRLSHVTLSFVDASTQAVTSEAIRAALSGLAEQGRSYLDLWGAYDRLEWETHVEEVSEFGIPRYTSWKYNQDGTWNFTLNRDPRSERFLRRLSLRDGMTELEAAEDIPGELTGAGKGGQGRSVHGVMKRLDAGGWTVDVAPAMDSSRRASDPPARGVLFLSLSGNRVSQDRRERARNRIWSGNAEMPGLARLIEGIGLPPPQARPLGRYRKILDRVIRDSFPNGSATPSQTSALHMALETPDVLLVQGPPGTGKTQFIAALLRCLDAVGESAIDLNRTLISSYQQDAVDNMVRKARVRGLPPSRIASDEKRARQGAREMRSEIIQKVQEHNRARPDVGRQQRLTELSTLVASYDETPSGLADLADILNRAAELATASLTAELAAELARLRASIAARESAVRTLLIGQHASAVHAARSLRTSEGTFADDGADRAIKALIVLDELQLVGLTDRDLLLSASSWAGPEAPAFLPELAALKDRLLTRLGTDASAASPVPVRDPEVQAFLHDIADAAERQPRTHQEGTDLVLADFLTALNSNVDLIQDVLTRYNGVLAATVQQTDSREMYRVVDVPLPVFGTVIIDEAARANPLDLMIPMSCARDRIILVGDHKQLPHAMERKIERELKRAGRFTDTSGLEQSLFQRWFEMFGRTIRTITLNEQFRMHPSLGAFVSGTFYGSSNAVKPHPSTHGLVHDLRPYQGKVAAWIDVPHSNEHEARDGFSFVRKNEAERVADELVALASQDATRKLTFGIISFYGAQIAAIRGALIDRGVLLPDDEDPKAIRPVPAMEWTDEPHPRERLRIGTVDAFQGMEFDVVLLSVTRSNRPRHDDSTFDAALRRYGHLTSDQRMCVAMSRQRRLLLAVGDSAMADRATAPASPDPGEHGRSVVEGLVAFLELCEGPDGTVIRS